MDTRLLREVTAQAEAERARLRDGEAEVARLRAEVVHLNRECQTFEDRSNRFEAEVARLREALVRIAEFGWRHGKAAGIGGAATFFDDKEQSTEAD